MVSLVVFRVAHPHNTPTRTHRSTVRSCHKTKPLTYGYCYSAAATTSNAYSVIRAHSSSIVSRLKQREARLYQTNLLGRAGGSTLYHRAAHLPVLQLGHFFPLSYTQVTFPSILQPRHSSLYTIIKSIFPSVLHPSHFFPPHYNEVNQAPRRAKGGN